MRLSGNARFTGIAVAAVIAGALILARGAGATPAPPGSGASVYSVPAAAQGAAQSFWTSSGMRSATAASAQRQERQLGPVFQAAPAMSLFAAGARSGPPRGTPNPVSFPGVRTVGALFYTASSNRHFCTASVVNSSTGNLVLTAAHCVYLGGYAQNLVFVPGYDDGAAPYGTWTVQKIIVANGWRQHQDPSLDYAYLKVVPPPHSVGPIQAVTGGLSVGFTLRDAHSITVVGYNDTDQQPIRCATKSFKFSASQMKFYCRGFWDGTSGGPWIIGYTGSGTGTVFGVIGGYEDGGFQSWASYSAIFWRTAPALFRQAEAAAA